MFKFKKLLSLFALVLFSISANAAETVMLVTIEKTIPKTEINAAINNLVRNDISTSQCYLNTELELYVDFDRNDPDGPYYGVAIINVDYECLETLEAFYKELSADKRYVVQSNGRVGVFPTVSGNN